MPRKPTAADLAALRVPLDVHLSPDGRFACYVVKSAAPDLAGYRTAGGLELEVFDHFTGTARPANTLSGGEGFLASLSLALGLADVVQSRAGGLQMETLFIDEGFGTLDPESLDFALRTLIDYDGINKTSMPYYGIYHQRPIQNGLPGALPDPGYKLDVEAVHAAAMTRLRPILMTTIATVAGHFPLTLVTGAGAVARNSIGVVPVGGMAIGTLFTLFVVPAVYVLVAKDHSRDFAAKKQAAEQGGALELSPSV